MPQPLVHGRYCLENRLSSGSGGIVCLAADVQFRDRSVVLKLIPLRAGSEDVRFLEPLARLASLKHPHLNPVLDFGRLEPDEALEIIEATGRGEPQKDAALGLRGGESVVEKTPYVYLVSPFLGGGNLATAASRFMSEAPEPDQLDRWLSGVTLQILSALRYLHDLSIIHFDIKPENILLAANREFAPGIPFVSIIDLGLSAPESTPLGNRIRGTFPYMAPEVLARSLVDHRVDLYSLGATLYHALTGGLRVSRTIEDFAPSGRPPALPPPAGLVPGLPTFWNDTIQKLLEPDPELRCPNSAVLLEEIRNRAAPHGFPEIPVTLGARPRLIGQEKEFDYIARELEKLKVSESDRSLIILGGEEGIGKRIVVSRLAELARLHGVETFQVRCRGDVEAPFDPLLRLFQQLRAHRCVDAGLQDSLDMFIRWLRDGAAPSQEKLPALTERKEERIRFFSQIASVFTSLARDQAYLFVVEDIQHAAPELIDALGWISHHVHLDIHAPPEPGPVRWAKGTLENPGEDEGPKAVDRPSLRVLLLTSVHLEFETSPASVAAPALQAIKTLMAAPYAARVSLKSLSSTRVNELVREVLGPSHLPARVNAQLHEISAGRWLTLLRLLRECQRRGHLRREAHGWVWKGDEQTLDRIAELRLEEWRRLPVAGRSILRLLDAAAGALPVSEVESALGDLEPRERLALIEQLVSEGWLRELEIEGTTTALMLDRSIPVPPEELSPEESSAWRMLARQHLRRRPDHPVSAVNILASAGLTEEIPSILPRALHVLRDLHCDASLVQLLERLRSGGHLRFEPEWELLQAQSLQELGRAQEALPLVKALAKEGAPILARLGALRIRGGLQKQQGKNASATRSLEECVELAKQAKQSEILVEVLIELGRLHFERNDLPRALELAREAEAVAVRAAGGNDALLNPVLVAQAQSFMAPVLVRQSAAQKAIELLREFLSKGKEYLPPAWQARLLNQIGELELEQAHYEEAYQCWIECLAIEERISNHANIAVIESNLWRIHYSRGEPQRALNHCMRSLRIRERISDRYGIAVCENNLGLIYKSQDELALAEKSFLSCLELLEQLGLSDKQAVVLNNLSDCMMVKGEYHLALKYSLRGLEKRKALNSPSGIAFSYYRIALIYLQQGELARAADYAEKSLELRRELGDKLSIANSLQELGELHLLRGNYYEAFRALRQSLSHFETVGGRSNRQPLLMLLGGFFQQMGLHEEAHGYFDLSLEIAREEKLEFLIGAALKGRAQLLIDEGKLSAAESDLNDSERIFRRGPIRRELAELLLARGRLAKELGNRERALTILAEAYSYVERLGVLDLYPLYYLLRGAIAAEGDAADLSVGRKLLERGLEEAQKLDLPEVTWRLMFALHRIALRQGQADVALRQLQQAKQVLDRLHAKLPTQFQDPYLRTAERAEVLAEWRVSNDTGSAQAAPVAPSTQVANPPAPSLEKLDVKDLLRLQEITLLLVTERDLKRLLDRIMDEVLDLFQAERGYIILDEGGQYEIRAARSLDKEDIESPTFKYSRSIANEVLKTGKTFLTNDAMNDERLRGAESVHDLRLQSIACFALEWRGARLGVIYLENRFSKRLVQPEQVKLLEAFSGQAAVAITNARLNLENEQRRTELEASQEHVEQLNRKLEIRVQEQTRELETTRRELQLKQVQLEDRFRFHSILGKSEHMQALYLALERVSATDLPVLIEGESGTGKELVARAIHFNSSRRKEAFVSENCGALAENLFESELFGHVRGAFTGAESDRDGLIAVAERGTLFLDEVHELSMDVQKKLLRFLQEGEYRPVGGKSIRSAHVRILTASNVPLLKLVKEKRFREDLYYRLNVLKIEVPPLRERGQDVLFLAKHFLATFCEQEKLEHKEFSPRALAALASYPYPGNVRELIHIIEKAAIHSPGPLIDAENLSFDSAPGFDATSSLAQPSIELPLRQASELFERSYLLQLLRDNEMVVARAARKSGITRESFHRLMKKYGILREEAG